MSDMKTLQYFETPYSQVSSDTVQLLLQYKAYTRFSRKK